MIAALAGLAPVLVAPLGAQTFVRNTADIPSGSPDNESYSENVDFGDLDLDGDFDAVFADGGDLGSDQNRIWINLGGDQGGIEGTFADETAARAPAINDQSRDVELADIDGDGDLDVFVANISTITNQASRFWINAGVGNAAFVDETATRWLRLGSTGSSIAPSQVLAGGGYVAWSGDGEFADLDADGDLDLVHSSYGSFYSGVQPTRLFRNNGRGYFEEFNPSGFQLALSYIQNGDPGLWCEGIQQHGTMDASGAFCDVATNGPDVDVGDTDGDLDLDILLGAREGNPRMFRNRLAETGGGLAFRDVTGAVFPPGYVTGEGHFEQELGDLDDDGDLDIYGVCWRQSTFSYNDTTLENLGDGSFTNGTIVPGTQADAEEADFVDYDGDGDLDVFVANFSGRDLLLRNDSAGAGIVLTNVSDFELENVPATCKDGEIADVDGDGDYDLFTAATWANLYYENVGPGADLHAPWFPALEDAPDRLAGPGATLVRAHVLDNAPYYATWYAQVVLAYTVDGGAPTQVPMRSSGGQVFLAEIPGEHVGFVEYRAIARDRYGNLGSSTQASYRASPGPDTGTLYCFGDGSGTACPCHNEGHASRGCASSAAHGGALLLGDGSSSVATDDFTLLARDLRPNQPCLLFQGDERIAGGSGVGFGDGLRCAGVHVVRLEIATSSALGELHSTAAIAAVGGAQSGDVKRYQAWYRDPELGPCGSGFNLTNALELAWTP